MNILLAAEYYFGNPRFVRFSIELAKRGHQVSVLTSHLPASLAYYKSHDAVSGIELFEANPHIDIQNPPYTVTFPLAQAVSIIKRRDIQICHTLMAWSTNSATVALISKGLGIPHVHEEPGIGTKTRNLFVDSIAAAYDLTMCRLVMKFAKRVVVLSRSQAERPIRLGANPEKIVVIPSGVDCSFFSPKSSEAIKGAQEIRDALGLGDTIIIGYVGRLVPVKGLNYLLLAMKEVQEEFPNAHLLVLGDGLQKVELERTARKLGLGASFVGWKRTTLPFLAAFDIFVLPSLQEGLSHSLLEAMAMEKPVIATNVGGNKDTVINGKNGFLVPTHNPKLLASSIKKLIKDDELRRNMGTFNRRTVEKNFTWEKTISKFEDLYRSSLH